MKSPFRVLALAVLLLASPFAFAQQGSQEQVDRLLEVMRARQTVDALMPQVQASQQQMVAQLTAGQQVSEEDNARIERILTQSNQRMAETLSWDRLLPLYRDIYSKTFTDAEMQAMIEFYESPAGQSLLDKMPLLMQNTMSAVQELVVPLLQQTEQDIRDAAGGE